uniref:CHCH domain-containing protein n=1 Tax=viral metagenome TaxID=1070528 RepID=A0A6C0KC36_9ZZZZ
MPRNSKSTVRSFHASTPTIFEKKNGFTNSAPVAAGSVGSVGPPSFGQVMKEGFAFGVGSSIARTMIDSAISRMSSQVESVVVPPVYVPPVIGITKEEIAQCKQRALSNKCDNLNDSTRQAWILCMKDTKFDDTLCDDKF